MKLQRLVLKNIRSYQDQEIIFPSGSILLSGDVGSGKTTILLALEYALFGLQPGQRGTSLLANGQDNGQVTLELNIDGQEVIIERILKRGSKGITQDLSAITISGVREEMSVTELKTKILSLLNYPEEFIKKTNLLYRYTVYAPQEEMKQIILEDPESRINVLRHIFSIDKYKIIKDNIAITTLYLRNQTKFLQFEVKDVEEYHFKIKSKEDRISLLKNEAVNKESQAKEQKTKYDLVLTEAKQLEHKLVEKQKLDGEIEKTNLVLASKIQNIAEQERELKKMDIILEKKVIFNQKLLEDILTDIKNKKDSIENNQKKLIDFTSRLRSLTIKKQEDLEKKERIFKIDICPTCLQNVSEPHKYNILNETQSSMVKIDKEVDSLIIQLQKINYTLSQEKAQLVSLEKDRSELESFRAHMHEVTFAQEKITEIKKQKGIISADIKSLEEHLTLLKESSLKLSTLSNLLRVKNEELKKITDQHKKIDIELAEIRKEMELDNKQILEYRCEIEKKEKSREKLTELIKLEDWLANDFSNLVSFTERSIMIKLRDEFSRLFNKWFSMLTTDNFTVRLDETFTPVVMQGDYELDYSFLSGGERTAVALAYRLSLNQLINSMLSRIKTRDIIILDEPTDGFSDQQLDKVRDILQELNVAQLIIVSHEQKIESFVDNIIRIKKEHGFSVFHSSPSF